MDLHLVYLCRFAVRAAGFNAVVLFLAAALTDLWPEGTGVTGMTRLPPPLPAGGSVILLRPTRAPPAGTGILTGCPSPTLRSLGLGPTHPTRTDLASEPLDLRRTWFSHVLRYSCHHSHSWSLQPPFQPTFCAHHDAPLPDMNLRSSLPRFGAGLEPRYIIRASAFDQ